MKQLLLLGLAFAAAYVGHSVPEFCFLGPDRGPGDEFLHFIFYNNETDQCEPFIWGGVGGNPNRFDNERECMRNCSYNVDATYPLDETKACSLKKAEGHCKNRFMRFYYDAVHDKCKSFTWTGCIGNGNRFISRELCNKTCDGIHEDGDDPEEDEYDTPVAIICGVLLGLIVASILITVAVLSVRSKKKGAKKDAKQKKEAKTEVPLREQTIEMND